MLSVAAISALANTAEVSTGNVRSGAAFDNIKASWNQALNIGDLKTKLTANYDYSANKDFLNEASLSGEESGVSYEVTHNFGSKATSVSLSTTQDGTTLSAEYDTEDQIKEVGLSRDVDLGGNTVGVQPSWLVKAKTARVKLMSALGDGKLSAQVDYATEGGATSYELGYAQQLEDGRDISASFTPADNNLEVSYVDSKFEDGATWTAKASIPTDSNDILGASKLSLKRSWSW